MHPLFHPVRVLCRIIVVCTQMFRRIATPSDTNGSLQGVVCGAWQMSAASRRSGRLRRPRLIRSLHARRHQTSRTRCWEIAAQIRCKRRRISGGKLAHRTACRFGGRAKQRACRRIQDGDIRTGTAHVLVPACVSERQGIPRGNSPRSSGCYFYGSCELAARINIDQQNLQRSPHPCHVNER